MATRSDTEAVNDRAKLMYHRLIARELRCRPDLIDKVKDVVGVWRQASADPDDFPARWEMVLAADCDEVARRIIARSPSMAELRLSSPFSLVDEFALTDVALRKRLWRKARLSRNGRDSERFRTWNGRSAPSPGTSMQTRSS